MKAMWGGLAAMTIPAAALAAGPLLISTSVMTEQRTAAADGTTRVQLIAPKRGVAPGDRVVFVLSYRNTGAQALSDVVLANPVPRAMIFRGAAAGSPVPDVSVDGHDFGPLATLQVSAADGAKRAAIADDVTAVRWRVAGPIAAGAQGRFAFQAVLK